MADVTISPGSAGPVSVAMVVRSPDFGALTAKGVTITFAKPDSGIEPIRREAAERDGSWSVDDLALPVAGVWRVRVGVLVTDFDIVNLDGEVTLRP
jgi:copper transport protein